MRYATDLSFITFNDHHLHRLLDLQVQMLNIARGSGDVGFHWGSKHRLASSFNPDDIIVIIVVLIIMVVIMDLIIFVTLPPGRWARRRWKQLVPRGNSSKRQLSQRLLNSPGGDKDFSCGILKNENILHPLPPPFCFIFMALHWWLKSRTPAVTSTV